MSRRRVQAQATCHHFCNNPMACPECVRRFYQWAQSHTHGPKDKTGPHFYEHVRPQENEGTKP